MTEEKLRWEGIEMLVQKGDVITSKKGLLSKTIIRGKMMCSKRMKYLGDGMWERLDAGQIIENVEEKHDP